MNIRRPAGIAAFALLCATGATAHAQMTADQLLQKTLEVDPWGLGDADVSARAVIKDANGSVRELAFSGRSRRYAPPLTKSIMRFSAPPNIKGVGFLQVQNKGNDDDRFLYLPELQKSRRIAGATRSTAFMGTDFSYADLDRKDLRQSAAVSKGDEKIGKFDCTHLELTPKSPDATYARMEMWVRKDNFVPLKALMYNKAGVLLKTLATEEMRRIQGRWYITKSLMTSHQDSRTTELILENITPRADIPDDEFTVRNLEKN
jgi:outer membrane lipoprotein-sorting protein